MSVNRYDYSSGLGGRSGQEALERSMMLQLSVPQHVPIPAALAHWGCDVQAMIAGARKAGLQVRRVWVHRDHFMPFHSGGVVFHPGRPT